MPATEQITIGQRVTLTATFRCHTHDGVFAMLPGTPGTVDRLDEGGRVGVWFDQPTYWIELGPGEYELDDDRFTPAQRQVLDTCAAHDTVTLSELAADGPCSKLTARRLRKLTYVLLRMKLIDTDYAYGGYPRDELYSLTDQGRALHAEL
jgi:hypothetical protein